LKTGQYWDLLAKGFFQNEGDIQQPDLGGLDFYLDAFRELSTCRPGGFDLQPIPFTAIVEYSRIYSIDDEDFKDIIRHMDDTFLALESETRLAEKKPKSPGDGKASGSNSDKTHPNQRRYKGKQRS